MSHVDEPLDCRAPVLDDAAAAPRAGGLRARLSRVMPWLSLCGGLASAVLMDRSPERASLIAVAAIGLWLCLMATHWAMRVERAGAATPGRVVRVARASALLVTQSLVQLSLFFSLPFYWKAATWDVGHALFLALLGGLAAATLWDPLTRRWLTRPVLSALVPAVASFAALDAVLPGLGISTHASLWLSSAIVVVGVPLLVTAGVEPARRRRAAGVALLVTLLPMGALHLGGARIIPAAPLRLVRADIGTERAGRWVADPSDELRGVPPRLICATAIWSPVGLRDRLFHVWERDGKLRARIELSIVGGRGAGYRTQSRIGPLGKYAAGRYRCRVETAAGQVLGSRTVLVRPARIEDAL